MYQLHPAGAHSDFGVLVLPLGQDGGGGPHTPPARWLDLQITNRLVNQVGLCEGVCACGVSAGGVRVGWGWRGGVVGTCRSVIAASSKRRRKGMGAVGVHCASIHVERWIGGCCGDLQITDRLVDQVRTKAVAASAS